MWDDAYTKQFELKISAIFDYKKKALLFPTSYLANMFLVNYYKNIEQHTIFFPGNSIFQQYFQTAYSGQMRGIHNLATDANGLLRADKLSK